MKKAILTFLLGFATVCTYAQPSQAEVAQIQYGKAENFYAIGNYTECLKWLQKTETSLGSSNPKIQYLRIKALYSQRFYIETYEACNTYFTLPTIIKGSEKYNEIVTIYVEVQPLAEKQQEEKAQEKIQEQVWENEPIANTPPPQQQSQTTTTSAPSTAIQQTETKNTQTMGMVGKKQTQEEYKTALKEILETNATSVINTGKTNEINGVTYDRWGTVAKTESNPPITNTTTSSTATKTLFEKAKTETLSAEETKTFFNNYLITTQFFIDQKEFNLKKLENMPETNLSFMAGMLQSSSWAINSNNDTMYVIGIYNANSLVLQKDATTMMQNMKTAMAPGEAAGLKTEEIQPPLFEPITTRVLKNSYNGSIAYCIFYADKSCNYTLTISPCPKSMENTILNQALANKLKQLGELNR